MENKECSKCGIALQPYWLKDGVCNGCRHPDLVVKAVVEPNKDKAALLALIYQPGVLCKSQSAFYAEVLNTLRSGLEDCFYEDPPNHLQQNILDLLRDIAPQIEELF